MRSVLIDYWGFKTETYPMPIADPLSFLTYKDC